MPEEVLRDHYLFSSTANTVTRLERRLTALAKPTFGKRQGAQYLYRGMQDLAWPQVSQGGS